MKEVFRTPLLELGEFEEIQKNIEKAKGVVELEGCVDAQKLHMIYGLQDADALRLIVTYEESKARALLEDYKLYDENVCYFPARDLIFYQADIKGNLLETERMNCIRGMLSGEVTTVITTIDALMEHMAPASMLRKYILEIDESDTLDGNALSKKLVLMGYEKMAQVDAPGQFAIRGGIIDIFPLTEENPCRIELWGEDIESIRSFDCESQRSIEDLSGVTIFPASELILTQEEKLQGLLAIEKDAGEQEKRLREAFLTKEAHHMKTSVEALREQIVENLTVDLGSYLSYFYKEPHSFMELFEEKPYIYFDEPVHVAKRAENVWTEFSMSMQQRLEKGYALPGETKLLFSEAETMSLFKGCPMCALSTISQSQSLFKTVNKYHISARMVNSFQNSFDALVSDLKKYKKNGYRVILLSPSATRAKRLAQDIQDNGLTAFYSENLDRELKKGEIMLAHGNLSKGFEYPLIGFVVITESDIFGQIRKKKKHRRTYDGKRITSFQELSIGDYVVHENHGLGIYQGIEHIQRDKITKDYLKISYRDGGNLYILATGLDVIQKYALQGDKKPKLNKLGTQEWNKTKSKVQSAVTEVAHDLVELYAKRRHSDGFVYSQDTVWQREFEELFPYDETEDQIAAIEATKSDMQSTKIMDRLICGDVGFGKTEVAIRAAFKAVQDGKQVALLAPTTILAQQHYNTFVQRMKDFPVRVDLMCRFRSPNQQKQTISDLKKGMVDIVIGTHRLLSKDIQFKDLGLLVIDEEQRFGVSHKEKIKKMRETVDVLTLTATPIPRTLHMSLVGIRDVSLLEEPPQDRMPIQTFVMEYNEEMVREAISRELSRGGQVYYVYNRVNTIADVTASLQELLPDAAIAYAHGQMPKDHLENLMVDFINGEIDVLVSTTIIETGLDIPNVNTIIIHDSDRLGLSQLYQLRGRVGRSNRTAYAFLMYKRDRLLKEEAEKRLSAIKEFTELGSGFKIAMKDLEIRGAGNILGTSQHGHMAAVGYELYCKMLNEAVIKEQGGKTIASFTTTVDVDMNAFIPESYVRNELAKLDLYKRIACIETQEEADDMIDEMTDRFGKPPVGVINLVRISLLRVTAHKLYVEELSAKEKTITFTFFAKAALDPGEFPTLLAKYEGSLKFQPAKENPSLIYQVKPEDDLDLLERSHEILEDMKILLD